MIFRTGERSIPNTGRDLNTGVMHAARVVVSTRQQKIGNSILALQIRYKFVGKGPFCARHSLELIEQIFNRKNYVDPSEIINRKGYKLYWKVWSSDYKNEDINKLFDILDESNQRYKYLLFSNLCIL